MSRDELDNLEREFAGRLGTPLEALRSRRADCPPLSMLRAAAGDALAEDRKIEIENHLRTCVLCRTLATDLRSDELSEPTPDEAQRIRARMATEEQSGVWAWMARPALAAAAAALLIWGGWIVFHKQAAPVITPPAQVAEQSKEAPIPPALKLEMPEVRLRASIVLVTRGAGDSQQYLKDLAPALDAYRAGNYTAAAKEFSALDPKYPKEIEVFFYGGVSSLREGANEAAVRSLERAETLSEREFADDIAWYLGLAYHRMGNLEASRAQFERLCAGASEFATRACDAAKELTGATELSQPR